MLPVQGLLQPDPGLPPVPAQHPALSSCPEKYRFLGPDKGTEPSDSSSRQSVANFVYKYLFHLVLLPVLCRRLLGSIVKQWDRVGPSLPLFRPPCPVRFSALTVQQAQPGRSGFLDPV